MNKVVKFCGSFYEGMKEELILGQFSKNKAYAWLMCFTVAMLIPGAAFAAETNAIATSASSKIEGLAADTVAVIGASLVIVALAIAAVLLVLKMIKKI